MASKTILGVIVAVLALALIVSSVGAMGTAVIRELEINGVEVQATSEIVKVAGFSGQQVPVRVEFKSNIDAENVRIRSWVSGDRENAYLSERFRVIAGNVYSRTALLNMPSDIDDDRLDEPFTLNVVIESKNEGELASKTVNLVVERESYVLEILDVDMEDSVKAGETLFLDVVLKNRGSQFAEDAFVRASIPSLGIEDRAYFGDLSAIDQSHPDKENTVERRLFLRIPSNAPIGLHVIEVEAFNPDSVTSLTRKVVVGGASEDTKIVAPMHSKSFAVGENGAYSVTIVNTGNTVRVYEFSIERTGGLTLGFSEPIVAVPAGTSRTVEVIASADEPDTYNFAINVNSDGELVKTESFSANVEENGAVSAGNLTVLLTVILAIVFIVLLVVLIVLLTRRPERPEETGESYY